MKIYTPMKMIDGAFYSEVDREYFAALAGMAAKHVWQQFRPYVEIEDLMGEAWLWAYADPDRVNDILDIRIKSAREKRMFAVVRSHLGKWARREKAHKCGYRMDDEVFYSLDVLREILPDAYEPEGWFRVTGPPAEAPIARTADPALGGDAIASYVDVRKALAGLPERDQEVLELKYRQGDSTKAIALALGISVTAATNRVERALGRLRKALGGARPITDAPEYIGSRRVISNATAQAMTE